jgi:hypothetical protein
MRKIRLLLLVAIPASAGCVTVEDNAPPEPVYHVTRHLDVVCA